MKVFAVVLVALFASACSANWDIGKGSVSIEKGGD